MNSYGVLVSGKNFLINNGTETKKVGFFVNVYVLAENTENAKTSAIELVETERLVEIEPLNTANDPTDLMVDEIQLKSNYKEIETKVQGLGWYDE